MRLPCLALIVVLTPAVRAADIAVTSPDGNVRLRLVQLDGRLGYEVRFKDRPAIEPSRLGITVDGTDIGQGVTLGEPKPYRVNETYPIHGGHGEAVNRCNGARVPVKAKV